MLSPDPRSGVLLLRKYSWEMAVSLGSVRSLLKITAIATKTSGKEKSEQSQKKCAQWYMPEIQHWATEWIRIWTGLVTAPPVQRREGKGGGRGRDGRKGKERERRKWEKRKVPARVCLLDSSLVKAPALQTVVHTELVSSTLSVESWHVIFWALDSPYIICFWDPIIYQMCQHFFVAE